MSEQDLQFITKAQLDTKIRMLRQEILGGGSDHGALSGLNDDDHSVIYYNKTTLDTMVYQRIFQSISDDDYYSFTPNNNGGILMVMGRYNFIKDWWGWFRYSTVSTNFCVKIDGYADMDATTGTLDGTTGVDGHITVSANDGDGKIYIENRRGGSSGLIVVTL